MYSLIFIAFLLISVLVHEAGHFIFAKIFGMKATKFFVGFGPTIWSKTVGETEYGIKAIPLGGYVRIVGMSIADEVTEEEERSGRLYRQQPAWQRIIVVLAGITINLILGYLLLVLAFAIYGAPVITEGGLVRETVGVGGALARGLVGPMSAGAIISSMVDGIAYIFSPQALVDLFSDIFSSSPRGDDSLVSIVGMAQITNSFANTGNVFGVLFMVAQLNLVLGVMNVLPFPPLDGGHVSLIIFEGIVNSVRKAQGKAADWHVNPDYWGILALIIIVYFLIIMFGTAILDVLKPATQLLEQ